MGSDVQFENHGSIFLARLLTQEALDWADEHTPDAQRWGNAIVIEHRYALEIAQRMAEDGLAVN